MSNWTRPAELTLAIGLPIMAMLFYVITVVLRWVWP